jgi:PAT family beta-lactamase induction signal transducer AmpG
LGVTSPRDRRSSLAELASDPRLALMLALGFSAGLPFLLVFGTLSAWLRQAEIARADIGMLSWVGLAYSFKFVWSPLVDRLDIPLLSRRLGRRRAWMLTAQLGVSLGLVAIAFSDPSARLAATVAGALLVAFASATQDVVIDAWRIDAAPTSRQGAMAAVYQLGYRLALICSGAGALYIADFVDWRTAYLAMAVLMGIGMATTLIVPRSDAAPVQDDSAKLFSFVDAVIEPFLDLWRRKLWVVVPILLLIVLYRVPDFVAGVMANPLYIDLGFTLSEIASVSKIYGVWIGILGAFAGGIAVTRVGLMPCVFFGGIIGAASNLMFAWLASEGHRIELLTLAISIDNFAAGFAGTALIAYMSGLTAATVVATQYALLSSLYALPGKFVGGTSGFMVEAFGYPTFFTLTAAVGIPIALLALLLWRIDPIGEEMSGTDTATAAPSTTSPPR